MHNYGLLVIKSKGYIILCGLYNLSKWLY